MRLGTQGQSIKAYEDRGIPAAERLLPDYLRELGYVTHLVGKWGVGKSRPHYLPSSRGFTDFYGFLGNAVDYFTYNAIEKCDASSFYGLDFFHNLEAEENQHGHLTYVLADRAVQVIRNHNSSVPLYLHLSHAAAHTGGALSDLQPPGNSMRQNDYITHPLRRLYAGLVTSLDKTVGHVIAALAEKDMLRNTLIAFVSDNGAPAAGCSQSYGSNFPLRGVKSTPWEGAVRSTGILWHSQLTSKIFDGLFHVIDWLPTLVTAAGGNVNAEIDGIDQWPNIIGDDEKHKRNDVLISIDETRGFAAYREGDFKIIIGEINRDISGHYGKDLKKMKGAAPFYDNVLFDCETSHVFKETLQLLLDIDELNYKREEFSLMKLYEEPNVNASACIPTKAKGCLFNVTADPLETRDLWYILPEIVRHLTLRLRALWTELSPRSLPSCDLRADPAVRNYVWSPWIENDEIKLEPFLMVPPFPSQVSVDEIQYVVDLNFDNVKSKINAYINAMAESVVKSMTGLFSL